MLYKILLVLTSAISLFIEETFSQVNLVPNPSFENYIQCPNGYGAIQYAINWGKLKNGGGGTPDLYNICSNVSNPGTGVPVNSFNKGFQYARSGVGYSGISVYDSTGVQREYIQSKLISKLIYQHKYCVTIYVSLINYVKYYCNKLGAYLDSGNVFAPTAFAVASANPQILNTTQQLNDTLNWMKIQDTFTATGIEEYISIGNFFSDISSDVHVFNSSSISTFSYYYIDDVSVIDVGTPAYAGKDTTIILGDSVFVGRPPEIGLNEDCIWFVNSNAIDTIAGMWVKPASTTTFVLQQTICGTVTYDTVIVTVNPNGIEEFNHQSLITIYPNPTTGDIWIKANSEISGEAQIIIHDLVGKKVYEKTMTIKDAVKISIDLQKGTYLISVKATNANFKPYNGKLTVIR